MRYQQKCIVMYVAICLLHWYDDAFAVLTMSQYKPDSTFEKPYFTQDYFANISVTISGGSAQHAYTQQGNRVGFLQQFGTEELLSHFVDHDLPATDTTSMGEGIIDGQFHVREMTISCYKNITRGFFIEGSTVIQDLFIDAISINFLTPSAQLSDEQHVYLQQLQQSIPSSINRSGMFTTAFFAGFHKTWVDFTHLDFIDFQIKIGFMSAQAMSDDHSELLQFPFLGNDNVGYPTIISTSMGVLDWLTIGTYGAVIPWQKATTTIAMNSAGLTNNLLISQSGVATIERKPLLTTALYLEADHFYHGLSATAGYCYTKNFSYKITPIDQIQFNQHIVNQSALCNAWSLGSLYFQFAVDFACEITPSAPVLTIFCNLPITGQLCPQTNIYGNSCNLQISYAF